MISIRERQLEQVRSRESLFTLMSMNFPWGNSAEPWYEIVLLFT